MRILIMAGLLSFLFGCSGAPAGMSADDVQNAALQIVKPLPHCSESWLGGTVEQCDAAQRQLDAKRVEYGAFEPMWMRKAIMDWLDFAQREIKEARADCVSQKSRKDLEAYRQRSKEEQERAQNILRSLGR